MAVDTAPRIYIPAPMDIPTPTVAHIPAEVVIPFTLLFRKIMMPEPIKPMAVTTPAATREGSSFTYSFSTSPNPYLEIIIIMAEATAMITWVLVPAVFFLLCLSQPIRPPQRAAATSRNT